MEDKINNLTTEELNDLIDTSVKEALKDVKPVKNESIILQDPTGARIELHSSIESLGALIGSAHDSLGKLKGLNGKSGKSGMTGVS